jgi:hypothetical protein
VQLTRAEFEDILRPRLETTVDVMLDMLDRAGFRPSEVDAVALVGGSSRIPAVVDLLAARTTMQVLVDPYPELTIALGAAQMVDDEVSSSSVFPLADMALPSLDSFGAVPTTGLVGSTTGPVGQGGPASGPVDLFGHPGDAGPGHNVGTAVAPPPGASLGSTVGGFDQTHVEELDMFGRPVPGGAVGAFTGFADSGTFGGFGGPGGPGGLPAGPGRRPPMSVEEEAFSAALDSGAGPTLADRLAGTNAQKGLVVLACFLAVLLFGGIVLALTGGGGDDDPTTVPDSSLVDETAGTVTDPDGTTSSNLSTSGSTSSSSSTPTTAGDALVDDDGDPATPPVVTPTTEGDGGPGSTSPGTTTRPTTTTTPKPPVTRPPPTTPPTSPPTTEPPTTTTEPPTTEPTTTTPLAASTSLEPTLRDDPPTE